jgi:hypothetical protein
MTQKDVWQERKTEHSKKQEGCCNEDLADSLSFLNPQKHHTDKKHPYTKGKRKQTGNHTLE